MTHDLPGNNVPRLRCIEPVDLILEFADRVRVPPGNTKEEHDAEGNKRDPCGWAILETASEER